MFFYRRPLFIAMQHYLGTPLIMAITESPRATGAWSRVVVPGVASRLSKVKGSQQS